jgi:lysozyme family protein
MEFFSTMNFKDAVKAAKIAYKKQWDQLKLDLIESDLVAAPLFSFAVNTGNSPAVKTLQKVLGVTEDGFIGTTTIAEVNQKDPEIVAKLYRAEWTSWYQGLVEIAPAKLPFLHEWLARAGFPYPTSIPEIYSA